MYVYKAEREAGLAELLKEQKVTLACSVQTCNPLPVVKPLVETATASTADELLFISAVLATAGWGMSDRGVPWGFNLNDDFFDPLEIYSARLTPENMPTNLDHDSGQIVGHIISNSAVDADLNDIADIDPDEPPGKMHVRVRSAVYKNWNRKELQERADKIVAALTDEKGPQLQVSMECRFKGFDYCVVENGVAKAVPRDRATAYLTKHLRAYGGKGTYGTLRVGRILRNITFSGMALVKNPANPESVVISEKNTASATVYGLATHESTMNELEKKVAEIEATLKKVEADRDSWKTKAEAADAKVNEKALAEARAREESLTRSLEEAKASQKAAEETLAAEKVAKERAEKALAELTETSQKAVAELAEIKAAEKKAARVLAVKQALSVDEKDAESVKAAAEYAESLSDLDDAKFDAQVKAFAKIAGAKLPPKSTPAQSVKQSTDKPAPNKASASQDASATLDQSDEQKDVATATEVVEDAEALRKTVKSKMVARLRR